MIRLYKLEAKARGTYICNTDANPIYAVAGEM